MKQKNAAATACLRSKSCRRTTRTSHLGRKKTRQSQRTPAAKLHPPGSSWTTSRPSPGTTGGMGDRSRKIVKNFGAFAIGVTLITLLFARTRSLKLPLLRTNQRIMGINIPLYL